MEGTGNFNATKEETAVAIAVSKGNQELLNDLNEAIGQIPSEELEKMIEDSCQYQPLEKTEEDVSTLSFFEMVNLLVHNYGLIFVKGAGIALLLALWRRQAITEELHAKPGETFFIPGGSGSFGQMAVPIAKALGLRVIVSGNGPAKETVLSAGADQYIVYTEENYWEILSGVDYIIDTLGEKEFAHELSVLKEGGILLSLRTAPNKSYAKKSNFPLIKQMMFSLAGLKYDMMARNQGKEYRFLFVRADGMQLEKITRMVGTEKIVPQIDSRKFDLMQINDAVRLVHEGHTSGKVIIRFP